jgi:hypothetical protein
MNYFLMEAIREINLITGEMDPSGFDDAIKGYVEDARKAIVENNPEDASRILSMTFDPTGIMQIIGSGIYDQLGEDGIETLAILVTKKKEVDEFDLENILPILNSHSDDDLISFFLEQSTFSPPDGYFYFGKWRGVRTMALSALCDPNEEAKVNAVIGAFKGAATFDFMIFYLFSLDFIRIHCNNEHRFLEISSLFVQFTRENGARLEEVLLIGGEIYLDNPTIRNQSRALSFQKFYIDLLVQFGTAKVLKYFFGYLIEGQFDETQISYFLSVIEDLGTESQASMLMKFHAQDNRFGREIDRIIETWRK